MLKLSEAAWREIAMFDGHYTQEHASAALTIQVNYDEGETASVTINGRRFELRTPEQRARAKARREARRSAAA